MRNLKSYRRGLLVVLPNLAFLDDRTVLEPERIGIEAFRKGGKEAELKARQEYVEAEKQRVRQGYLDSVKIFEDAKVERKKQFKRMIAEVKTKKPELPE